MQKQQLDRKTVNNLLFHTVRIDSIYIKSSLDPIPRKK
jgi:hypothetical protein